MYGYGNTMFLATHGILARSASGGGVDPDAQAFITAASITDLTQQSAINQLVVDLKGYNIWTKFKAIYPIVGGVASSHSVNLKTPGTYNLTFASGWTHSSTGMTPLNAYADTAFNVNAYRNNNHISYYSRTNIDEVTNEIGAANVLNSESFSIGARISNIAYFGNHLTSAQITFANTDSRGLFLNSRTANNLYKAYKNGSLQANSTVLTGANINYNMYLGARNVANTPTFYTTKQCAFASIGDGLTDTEAANLYTAVQAYQTTLGRQV